MDILTSINCYLNVNVSDCNNYKFGSFEIPVIHSMHRINEWWHIWGMENCPLEAHDSSLIDHIPREII